jgi:hypothetical protein
MEIERDKLRTAMRLVGDVRDLAGLIRAAADIIRETCGDDRDGVIQAFDHGSQIVTAAEVIIEKLDEAIALLDEVRHAGDTEPGAATGEPK